MPKWVYVVIGLSFSAVVIAIAYRIFIGDGGRAEMGDLFLVEVPPARIEFDSSDDLPEENTETDTAPEGNAAKDTSDESIETSEVGAAIVFDPPSNIRAIPNGKILCSVTSKGSIRIYDEANGWYQTDACGKMGVIHESQISFDPSSIK